MPSSPAAECALLGAVLVDEETAWAENVGAIVAISDFFVPAHRAIWEAMLRLRTERTAVSVLTVADMLSRLGYIDAVDRLTASEGYTEGYLVGLLDDVWAATGCSAHARMVHEYAERRQMLEAGVKLIRDAQSGQKPPPSESWLSSYEGAM